VLGRKNRRILPLTRQWNSKAYTFMTPLEESTALRSQFTTGITNFFFKFRVSEMYLDGAVQREGMTTWGH